MMEAEDKRDGAASLAHMKRRKNLQLEVHVEVSQKLSEFLFANHPTLIGRFSSPIS
jgi:hypothetical protein